MDTDDLEPPAKKAARKDLDIMSIEALNDYITDLEAEITRAGAAIEGKQSARQGAETFFK